MGLDGTNMNLDDRYIKAYSRRSTTRKELGKLKESIEEPEIKKQYGEVKALYEKVTVELATKKQLKTATMAYI
uniref:Uncharacterized protein n=1 Tax=Solanum tuberosum TaxID=4113 RepID=M1AF11_SOLTU